MREMVAPGVAVWLYGSCARADSDTLSDIDVLVVGANWHAFTNSDVGVGRPLRVTQYTWPELEGMSSAGSLFLEHLKREAKPLTEGAAVEGRLRHLLETAAAYSRARALRDVRAF